MLTASGKWQFTKDGGVKVSWIFGPLSNADWKDGLLLQGPRPLLENKSARGDRVGAILPTHSQAVTSSNPLLLLIIKGVGAEKTWWYWDEQGEKEQCAKAQVNLTIQ